MGFYEYEDFIDGLRPTGVSLNGVLNLEFINGVFKQFCIKVARENEARVKEDKPLLPYFFIVDEINRANLSAVFGETLSMLEDSYRDQDCAIRTKNSIMIERMDESQAEGLSVLWKNGKSKFYVPSNIYFIGMMNDVDKSIDCFDLALRRRFTWFLMECDYDLITDKCGSNYSDKCKALNDYITDTLKLGRAYEIGHSYFLKKESMNESEIWANHIEPILREYLRSVIGDDDIDNKLEEARKSFFK